MATDAKRTSGFYVKVRRYILGAARPSDAADAISRFPPDILAEAAKNDAGSKMLKVILRHGSDKAWLNVFQALMSSTAAALEHCRSLHASRVVRMLIAGIRDYDALYDFASEHLEDLESNKFGAWCLEEAVGALDRPRRMDLARRLLQHRRSSGRSVCAFTLLCLDFYAKGADDADSSLLQAWPAAPGKYLRTKLLRAMCRRFPLFSVDPGVSSRLARDEAFALGALYACAPALHEACYCDEGRSNLARALRCLPDAAIYRFLSEQRYSLVVLRADKQVDWGSHISGKSMSLELLRREPARVLCWHASFTLYGAKSVVKFARGSSDNLAKAVDYFSDAWTIRRLACDSIAVTVLAYLCDKSADFRLRVFSAFVDHGRLYSFELVKNEIAVSLLARVTARWPLASYGPYHYALDNLEYLLKIPTAARLLRAIFRYAPKSMAWLLRDLHAKLAELAKLDDDAAAARADLRRAGVFLGELEL
jgi:hypothetical protein